MNIWSFLTGFISGTIILSVCMGSVPKPAVVQPDEFKPASTLDGQVTDDTALYQNLSEIRVAPEKSMDFDKDLHRLSKIENRYRERIRPLNPRERMSAPMQRVSQTQYRYSSRKISHPAQVSVKKSAPEKSRVMKRSKVSRPRIGVPMNSH